MKEKINLSGIEEPEASWWDELRVGVWPMLIVAFFLLSVAAIFIGFFN